MDNVRKILKEELDPLRFAFDDSIANTLDRVERRQGELIKLMIAMCKSQLETQIACKKNKL